MRALEPRARAGVQGLILAAAAATATGFPAPSRTEAPPPAPPVVQGVTFTNSGQSLGGETGNAVAMGDLDGDGDLDALVANEGIQSLSLGSDTNRVWLNDGQGTFTIGEMVGIFDGEGVALGDLDGDGDLDAVIPGPFSRAWLNNGSAQFTGANLNDDFGTESGVALGDVDNDGDLDVLLVGGNGQVLLNNGNATFVRAVTFSVLFSRSAAIADLDGDGWRDLVVADAAEGTLSRVYWNDGNWSPGPGSFTPGAFLPADNLVNTVAVADLDGDARQDVVLAALGPDRIYWNQGGRNFTGASLTANDSSWAVALADVDADGRVDAVVGNITAEPNRLWHNEGGRAFAITQEFGDEVGLYWSRGLAAGDVNGDGAVDLFETTTADDRVWFNTAPPVVPVQEGWQRQTLDDRGNVGEGAALALDGAGHPHIAYLETRAAEYDETRQSYVYEYRLRYVRWDGVRWHRESVPIGMAPTQTFRKPSLAVSASGTPHIVFEANDNAVKPRYVHRDATGWVSEVLVPTQHSSRFSVAVDASGTPHLVYAVSARLDAPAQVRYAVRNGSAWSEETIEDLVEPLNETWLTLDGAGDPHVTYTGCFSPGCTSTQARYARRSAGTWQHETIPAPVCEAGGIDNDAPLVIDGQGVPHVVFLRQDDTYVPLTYGRRTGGTWQFQVVNPGSSGPVSSFAIDLDTAGVPHVFYRRVRPDDATYFEHARLVGSAWQVETLDKSADTDVNSYARVAMALDGADNLHAAYQEPEFKDLRYVSFGLEWQSRTVPETGTVRRPALDVDDAVPFIAYQGGSDVKLADADDGWTLEPLDPVAAPVTDLAVDAGLVDHVSYYDADAQRLMYAYRTLVGWTPEVVDESGDAGAFNDLVIAGQDTNGARIAYWDAVARRIKLAVPVNNSVLWNIHPNVAAPTLAAGSGSLSATLLPEGDVGVAYYDGGSGDLRLGVWDAKTATWTDELVDATGDAGRLNALQADGEGFPVVAYTAPGGIRMAYKVGGLWQAQDVPNSGGTVTGLALELGLNSWRNARIAYTRTGEGLNAAELRRGVWRTRLVVPAGPASAEVSAAHDGRLHLAYTRGGALQYSFRTANVDIDLSAPGVPPPEYFEGPYNPLDACKAGFGPETGGGPRPSRRRGSTPGVFGALLGDEAIFHELSELFEATTGGAHFMGLYFLHGAEMGRLGLTDPGLLWDAHGALQNFMPGLEALVTGHGSEVVVTQGMVDDARSIWQRLAAAGSPQLRTAIHTELSRFDDLQDFVNMTFDEWAEAIGVGPPKVLFAADAQAVEGNGGPANAVFQVRLSSASTQPVLVGFATADGTAVAGTDYTAVSGTLTLPPGAGSGTVSVPLLGDVTVEGSETFALVLTNAQGASLGDGQAQGTIVDDDAVPALFAPDAGALEGDGGTRILSFEVRLDAPYGLPVTVAYATADGTATAPVDYAATSGMLTFPPGVTALAVDVTVVADFLDEPHETLRLDLAAPQNATLLDPQSVGFIVDDDPRYAKELRHGFAARDDLAARQGPAADEDLYRILQEPHSSYEIVLDEASGDAGGPDGARLERVAPDGSTVLQTSRAVGTGRARSLRWQNTASAAVRDQVVRVASTGCTTDCGADDRYRLRAYDTTGRLARFNNSASQVTILLLQNRGSEDVSGVLWFWSANGAPLASRSFSLTPRATLVLNTASVPGVAGQGGSVTVSNDGALGALVGKAVALEPATGFAFDTPMEQRAR